MLLRIVTATACFVAAALAVTPFRFATDVGDLDRLAALQSEQSIPLLTEAHLLQPRDTSISLQLGLELERAGDLARAETILLHAARFDHQYQPAWTLANFYFRRENRNDFWTWAARAAAINHYDLRPLLRLATVWAPEPQSLVRHLGDRPELLRPYIDILIGESRPAAAAEVALLLAAHHDPADRLRLQDVARRNDALRNIPSGAKR